LPDALQRADGDEWLSQEPRMRLTGSEKAIAQTERQDRPLWAAGFTVKFVPDGEMALRYNLFEPVLGRGQVARHRVLVPGSQVRILPPQPGGRDCRTDDR
jgi:hypothetical protein